MNPFGLILGLALPWLAGLGLMAWLDRDRRTGALARRAGNGYFIGIAMLYFAVRLGAGSDGVVAFYPVLAGLLALTGLSWLAGRRLGDVSGFAPETAADTSLSGLMRLFLYLLLAWSLAHLLFALLEVIVTPVFPWDAWTVWMYRAKAWILAGHLFDFVSVKAWFQAESASAYGIPGSGYPLLPSVVAFWAALSLDGWHEALVNLPVWLCGLAIVVAFYGQCRAAGLSLAAAVVFAYLLVSTPLLGVHMSLAGYADIWLAGFAGLGFVALLRGVTERHGAQVLLGFALLTAGLLVKNEGVVWLMAAIVFYAVMRIPWRVQLYVGGTVLVVAWLLAWLGMTEFNLPYLGRFGFSGDLIMVPGAGVYRLELHDVREAYLTNAFELGSWNLAWVMVLVGAMSVAVLGRGRLRVAVLVFFGLFALTQVLIFVWSSEGAWARDYTAINRLPLQMYPALLFATALATVPAFRRGGADRSSALGPRLALVMSGALLLVAAGAWVQLERQHVKRTPAPLLFGPGTLAPVVGSMTQQDGVWRADGYQGGVVLLSSGPVSIDAEARFVLRPDLEVDPDLEWPDEAPAFFWRRKGDERTVSRVTLGGAKLVDLSISEDWQDEIVEVGLFFPEHGGEPARFREFALQGESPGAMLRLLPYEWFEFEPWTQRSAHYLFGGAPDQRLPLVTLVVAWVVLALLAWLALARGGWSTRATGMVAILLAAWLVLDVRWSANRVRQASMSWAALQEQGVDERISASELGQFYDYLLRIREEVLGAEPSRVLLVLDPELHKFYGLRSKYQLLPHSVVVRQGLGAGMLDKQLDHVLFLGAFGVEFEGPPSRGELAGRVRALPLDPAWRSQLALVDIAPQGLLFTRR